MKMILPHFPRVCLRLRSTRALVREAWVGHGFDSVSARLSAHVGESDTLVLISPYVSCDPWRIVMASFFLLGSLDPGGIEVSQEVRAGDGNRLRTGREWQSQSTSPWLWLSLLVAEEGGNDLLVKPLPRHPQDRLYPPTAARRTSGLLLTLCSRPLAQSPLLLQTPRLIWDPVRFFLRAVLEF